MENVTKVAVAKELKKTAEIAREALTAGTYNVNDTVTLHIQGTLKVGEDSDYTPTTSIPYKAALALFVRYCGITREAAMEALTKAMKEAIEANEAGEQTVEKIQELADLAVAEAKVQEGLDKLPKKTKKGAVTGKLTITEVETQNQQQMISVG